MSLTVNVDLSALRASLGAIEQANEASLAACAGHAFVPLNPALPNSNEVCARCGGIAHAGQGQP